MTDKLSNNTPVPFIPSGNPPVLPDSPSPSEVAVDPIPPLPSISPNAANPPTEFGVPLPPPASPVPEEDPVIRPPGASSAAGGKSGDPYIKKRHGSPKAIIAGIVSLVFFVVALGSGLYLVKRQGVGEIRRQAEICTPDSVPTGNCDDCGWENQGQCGVGDSDTCNCNSGNAPCDPGFEPNGAGGCRVPVSPTPPGGGLTGACPPDPVVWCATFDCPQGDTDGDGTCNPTPHDGYGGDAGATYTTQFGSNCPQPDSGCGQIDKYNSGTPGVDWDAYCGYSFINFTNCQIPDLTATPRPTRTPTPIRPSATPTPIRPSATPTPETISASCVSLVPQMSDADGGWVTKTDAEFTAQARPGDWVRFVCTGHKTQGTFTKAAFFINNTLHVDDVVKLNENQFAVEYAIPAAGSLEVESVLLHDTKGWVD